MIDRTIRHNRAQHAAPVHFNHAVDIDFNRLAEPFGHGNRTEDHRAAGGHDRFHIIRSAPRMIEREFKIEFLRQFDHGDHIKLRAVHLDRHFMPQHLRSVFHRRIPFRHFCRIVLRFFLFLHVFLNVAEILAQHAGHAHPRHRHLIALAIDALRIAAHRRFQRDIPVHTHRLDRALPRAFHRADHAADHIAAARSDRAAGYPGSQRFLKGRRQRIDPVEHFNFGSDVPDHFIDILRSGRDLKAADMTVRVDNARNGSQSRRVDDLGVFAVQLFADRRDLAIFN